MMGEWRNSSSNGCRRRARRAEARPAAQSRPRLLFDRLRSDAGESQGLDIVSPPLRKRRYLLL